MKQRVFLFKINKQRISNVDEKMAKQTNKSRWCLWTRSICQPHEPCLLCSAVEEGRFGPSIFWGAPKKRNIGQGTVRMVRGVGGVLEASILHSRTWPTRHRRDGAINAWNEKKSSFWINFSWRRTVDGTDGQFRFAVNSWGVRPRFSWRV